VKIKTGLAVGATVVALLAVGTGGAVAQSLVTSRDIKDGTVRVKDMRAGAIKQFSKPGPVGKDGAQGVAGKDGKDGAPGLTGQKGADATYVGPNWSIIDRNVIGNGDSHLRAGPDNAPLGQGSLGIRTGAGTDAASFGNQSDFAGLQIADITHLGFAVFTTDANNAVAPNNMPSIKFEIDPNVTGASNYTTLVYAPDNGQANAWSTFDAVADTGAHWGFTGSFFNNSATMNERCGINGSRCTFAQIQSYLAANNDAAQGPAKVSYSIAVGKGRDFAFSGAVDALRINNQVFDFEPFGVYTRTP
jgi:hypothetical protein